jgi:nicotinamide-nucleotide amidase
MPARQSRPRHALRPILTAELLSIGSELTVGETRDTNAGDLARELSGAGVRVARMTALPDDLQMVSDSVADGLARADLVISTGGLGPTPDDLTREAIAAAVGETPAVDPALEAWLRELFARRSLAFPERNLKQAWLIPSAAAIPNPNGTAPGWWVDRPDGRLVVALPGPPREMRPMWRDWAWPRLEARGVGRDHVVRVLRLAGIGESAVAERLGDELLRAANPVVATYARADAVDVRISAVAARGRSADALADAAERRVLDALGVHVWATGSTSWGEAIEARLAELGWRLALVEIGTRGSVGALLGDAVERIAFAESLPIPPADLGRPEDLAERVRASCGAEVGLAVRVRPRTGDTAVSIAVVTPAGSHRERRVAFLAGAAGRTRAALAAADVLLAQLRAAEPGRP